MAGGEWRIPRRLLIGRLAAIALVTLGELAKTAGLSTAALARPGHSFRDAWAAMPHGLLTRLGPSFVKAGQLLATRSDLVPERWIAGLRQLVDTVPPPAEPEIRAVLTANYASQPWPFAKLDIRPIASGSIATVHRAELRDGTPVAVKIRRPGIDRTMLLDFRLALAGATVFGRLPNARRIPAAEMIGQVGTAVLAQLDFAAEREALVALRANLSGLPGVVVPRPLERLCTEKILVMEYLPDLRHFTPESLTADARRDVVKHTLAAVYQMLFVDGLVHCDLHPGNLYLTRAAEIIVLDAGFVVRLPERVRSQFTEFFLNMALGRGRRCADVVIESAAGVPENCDLDGFRARLTDLVTDVTGSRAGDFSLARFAPLLFRLQRSFGLYAAPEFAFPLLSLLVIEGMVNEFDSEVDFQAEALPVLMRAVLLEEAGSSGEEEADDDDEGAPGTGPAAHSL